MRKVIFYILIFFSTLTANSQSEQQLITEAIRLESAFQEPAALEKLTQALKINPRNYVALWKTSELYSRLGFSQKGKNRQLDYYNKARQYAEQSIRVQPNGAEGYYALSVAMGRLALSSPGKEKIAAVKAIKQNAEKAISLDPNHGRAWHVLGKWHFEVSGLNFVERNAVKLFFGAFPPSSVEESIRAYEKAHNLEPNFALNHLELAKAYIRKGHEQKAKAMLQRLASLPNKTGEDNRIKSEGAELLRSLN